MDNPSVGKDEKEVKTVEETTITGAVAAAAPSSSPPQPPPTTSTPQQHDEVLERLLSKEELQQTVQGVWSFFSNPVQQALEKTKVLADTIKSKAQETLVDATALAGNTSNPNGPTPQTSLVPLPWENVAIEFRPEAKSRILKLSMEDRTFVVPPPADAKYSTNVEQRAALAKRMLEADPLLSAKRFKLVPKSVEESAFWLNYFYRVDIILEAVGASATSTVVDTSAKQHAVVTSSDTVTSPGTAQANVMATTTTTTTNNTSIVVEDSQLRDEEETFDLVDDAEMEFGEDEADDDGGDVRDLEKRIEAELGGE